jgi:hypothetical protein
MILGGAKVMRGIKDYEENVEFLSKKVVYDTLINYNLIFKKRDIYINLLDKSGDAEVTMIDNVLNSGVTPLDYLEVNHTCLGSGMEFEEMGYKVSSGNTDLEYKVPLDLPKEKKIKIYFKKPLAFQEESSIKEEFLWKRMFPSAKEEFYFASIVRPMWALGFSLKYPHDRGVKQFWIDRITQLSGEKERLPETFDWDKNNRVVKSEIIPNILCYYKYTWKY